MSINWVMTSPSEQTFVKLPSERILYTSPPRVHLQLSPPTPIAGTEPFSVKSESGVVYITNQRIVYLPANPTPELTSFSAPISNLQDSYVRAPFFGANYWIALCRPVPDGGIPPSQLAVEVRLTFRDGGAFDFSSLFEQIKERMQQAREAREASGGVQGVDVHLEQLPAYEAAHEVADEEPAILSPRPVRPGAERHRTSTPPPPQLFSAPDEPPPGYDEAQAQVVGVDLDERLRIAAERQRNETP